MSMAKREAKGEVIQHNKQRALLVLQSVLLLHLGIESAARSHMLRRKSVFYSILSQIKILQ